jgi:hypothetical protein
VGGSGKEREGGDGGEGERAEAKERNHGKSEGMEGAPERNGRKRKRERGRMVRRS